MPCFSDKSEFVRAGKKNRLDTMSLFQSPQHTSWQIFESGHKLGGGGEECSSCVKTRYCSCMGKVPAPQAVLRKRSSSGRKSPGKNALQVTRN